MEVKIDTRQIKGLSTEVGAFVQTGFRLIVGEGLRILGQETSRISRRFRTQLGEQPSFTKARMRATLVASAIRPARSAGVAMLYTSATGKPRAVPVRATPPFDFAAAVALGTGVYGPRRASIRPVSAKGLLVPTSMGKGTRLILGGRPFTLAASIKGTPANPYHERTADRIEEEIEDLLDRAFLMEVKK